MISQTVDDFAVDMESLASRVEQVIPEALQECTPLVLDNIIENFARQESPDGLAWPDRKEEGDGHPLLVETMTEGSGSLFVAASGQGGGHVSRVEGNTLIIGVDKEGGIGGIPGAGVHNYGFPEKNIPQREFLGIGDPTADQCGELIANYCLDVISPS